MLLYFIEIEPFKLEFFQGSWAFYLLLLKPNTSGHVCKLALATVCNDNLLASFPTLGPVGFHLLHHLHALYHLHTSSKQEEAIS